MFEFTKYKSEQDKISKILQNLNGSTFFTSQAKTLMQLFVLNVEIPDGLKIDFSSIEEFSFPISENKTTENTLNNLLLILPYEYWKKTINPSIFYNKKVLEDAFFVAASKNNLEFIKESYIQLINLTKNIPYDDNKYQTIYENPASVPYPVNKTYIYNHYDSYLEIFSNSCSLLAQVWQDTFPIFLTNKNLSTEEKVHRIKEINNLEKFSLVYFYKLMGNCPSPILTRHKNKDFIQDYLKSVSQFKTVEDINKWCIENENIDPKAYIQNNYISLEEKYNEISFSFFVKNKLDNINKYFYSLYERNHVSSTYASAYNKKHRTNFKEVFEIDKSVYYSEFSKIDSESFKIFMQETLNGYLKNSKKKKLSLDITKNINSNVIMACSFFNSDYLEEYLSIQTITKSNFKDRFISMVEATLAYNISNDRFSTQALKLIKCLAVKNLYLAFKKQYKQMEDLEDLDGFRIFDIDFSSDNYDPSTLEKVLSPDSTISLLNCLNYVFQTVTFTETSSYAKKPVSFSYFLSKDIVSSSKNQNLKFLKVADYTETLFNNPKKIISLSNVKLDTQIFQEITEDIKEHVFMEICQIEKSKVKKKVLKF